MPGSALPTHPLDPLTAAEIEQAVALLRADGRLGERVSFWGAALDEVRARDGERRVRIVVTDHAVPAAWEVDVALGATAGCLEWRPLDHRRPGVTSDEARAAAQACRNSPLFKEALAKRGIHDVSLVMIDAESMGGFEPARFAGRRLTWGTVWHRVSGCASTPPSTAR
jgi:primary-amine oxidase